MEWEHLNPVLWREIFLGGAQKQPWYFKMGNSHFLLFLKKQNMPWFICSFAVHRSLFCTSKSLWMNLVTCICQHHCICAMLLATRRSSLAKPGKAAAKPGDTVGALSSSVPGRRAESWMVAVWPLLTCMGNQEDHGHVWMRHPEAWPWAVFLLTACWSQ